MHRRATLTLVLCAACGGGGSSADAPPSADAGPNDLRPDRIGVVDLIQGSLPSLFAQIMDGPDLPTPELAMTIGECKIFVRPAPASCSQGCTTGVCTAPDVCTPYPAPASAGPITVAGLLHALQFTTGAYGYTPDWSPSDGVLFDPGAAITVSAPGDATPAFAASLTGLPDLVTPFQNLSLVDHEDAEVT